LIAISKKDFLNEIYVNSKDYVIKEIDLQKIFIEDRVNQIEE